MTEQYDAHVRAYHAHQQIEAARAMLAALQAIQALPAAAVDCVRGGIDLAALIARAKAAGIVEEVK